MTANLSVDLAITCLISALSLAAVWLPLTKALRLCVRAREATRRVSAAELRGATGRGPEERVEPLALLMVRILRKSLRERRDHPLDFVVDATRQYVFHEYESHYARPLSMLANLLPPIGFIGTTGGMLVLFLSMHVEQASLELSALAIALTSSIFALMGFALLESARIRLYGRLLACLDDVLALQRDAEQRAEAAGRPARP